MHTIDLKNKGLRTDLVIDEVMRENEPGIRAKIVERTKNITVEEVVIDKDIKRNYNKKAGIYETISFKDITDKNNFKETEEIAIKTLKRILGNLNIEKQAKILVVGLGNELSTPDALGPKTIDHVLVTRHLFQLGEVEDGYKNVASFKPSVTGVTGIETKDLIESIKDKIKPDLLIVIDALASSSIERLNKTIQITTAGISPGSGVGNNRQEISKDTLNIPVIAIGVPTVVDGATIVENTIQLLLKKISYQLNSKDDKRLKLIPITHQNYLEHENKLNEKQKEDILGMVGLLDEQELKSLILEVLLPVNYNMIVTPKEIDYLIDKLSLLLGNTINKSLHEHFNPTN